MFVSDHMTASPSLAGMAAVALTCSIIFIAVTKIDFKIRSFIRIKRRIVDAFFSRSLHSHLSGDTS